MAFNLQRDAKFIVSEVSSGFTTANSFEVRVLAGFNVNQTTATSDVTVDEAGATPARGMRRYNTAINPTDITFSTYARPYKNGVNHDMPERILWEGLSGAGVFGTNATTTSTNSTISFANSNVLELKKMFLFVDYGDVKYRVDEFVVGQVDISFDIQGIATLAWTGSGKYQQQIPLAQFPAAGSFTAVPDFAGFIKNKLSTISLQGNYNRTPATQNITFTGTGLSAATAITVVNAVGYQLRVSVNGGATQTLVYTAVGTTATMQQILDSLNSQIVGATITAVYTGTLITWTFTTNKVGSGNNILVQEGLTNPLITIIDADTDITVATIVAATAGTSTSRTYTIPITGGNITINNNITYLTPEELGIVNRSIGHFTGTRMTSGSLTAYLRSGSATDASQLQKDLLAAADDDNTSLALSISVGGAIANSPKIVFAMPTAHLAIPTIDTQDVISTSIDFAAIPSDLDQTNDLTVTYTAT